MSKSLYSKPHQIYLVIYCIGDSKRT